MSSIICLSPFSTLTRITLQRPPSPEIVIYRVITPNEQEARRFLSDLKAQLKETFQQEEILIVECDVETL